MQENNIYQLGKVIGSLQTVIGRSMELIKNEAIDDWKVHYVYLIEKLFDLIEALEESNVSEPTLIDVSEEMERLVEKYGELKFDKTLPRGQRILGGIKQKISLIRQSRKTIKKEDIETLHNKLSVWDDRLKILFSEN